MLHSARASQAISLRIRPICQAWGYLQVRSYGKRQESKQWRQRPNRKARLPLILIEEVPNLGVRGEVVRVKHGYGRNYLLPKNKAVYCTPDNMKLYDVVPLSAGETSKSVVKEHLRKLLERKVIRIEVTEEGEPVWEAHVSYALRKQLQLQVPFDRIQLSQPIESLGDNIVNVTTDDDDILPVHVEVVLTNTEEDSARKTAPAIN